MSISTLIDEQLPASFQAAIPQVFKAGHALAWSMRKEHTVLQVPSMQTGDLRAACIDFLMNQLVNTGRWPTLTCSFPRYAKPTGKYMRIDAPGAMLTVSHVAHPSHFPRRAEFRSNAKLLNEQLELFAEHEQARRREREEAVKAKACLLMLYGDQQLEFLIVGAPHPTLDCWLEVPVDLKTRLHLAIDNDAGIEATGDLEIPMDLKDIEEGFRRFISDQDEDDAAAV